MTQLHFTFNEEEIQSLIEESVSNNAAKILFTKLLNSVMEKERDEYLENSAYERDIKRTTYRNGYYDRSFTTKIGTLELRVPRTRDGKFSTQVFERYQRNEKALILSMLEMYIDGVSTRKVSKVMESLCEKSYSKSFVSSLTKTLDSEVEAFKSRALSEKYPYVLVDVIYIKVRENHKVVSKATHIAIGIDSKGDRSILGFQITEGESEQTWKDFFRYLADKGLRDTKMIISDAHKGLVSAIKSSFSNTIWQRCQVHFIRNILARTPKKETSEFREDIKALLRIQDIGLARKMKEEIFKKYETQAKYEKALRVLDDGFEDVFAYLGNENVHKRLRSTNAIERLNEEIRRRERVIRIFPNVKSAERLIGALLIDKNEEWEMSERTYIKLS